jgi:proline dehydrogenase
LGLVDSLFLPIAKHFIAGANLGDAIITAKKMNSRGFRVIINFLGEEIRDEKELGQTMNEYLSIFDQMDRNKVDGCVSVKPTQLGLTMGFERAEENLHIIVERAKKSGTYLWVDMEGSPYTEQTIELYLKEIKGYDRMGIAIQAYLRRTSGDIDHLVKEGGQIRLCKGAYNEPASVAFKDKKEMKDNYSEMMKKLFTQHAFFAIATHDDKLQDEAKGLAGGDRSSFEFQMLRGVREELGRKLLGDGYRLSVYLPYGANWLPYGMRRMKERKRNVLLLFRSLISG